MHAVVHTAHWLNRLVLDCLSHAVQTRAQPSNTDPTLLYGSISVELAMLGHAR